MNGLASRSILHAGYIGWTCMIGVWRRASDSDVGIIGSGTKTRSPQLSLRNPARNIDSYLQKTEGPDCKPDQVRGSVKIPTLWPTIVMTEIVYMHRRYWLSSQLSTVKYGKKVWGLEIVKLLSNICMGMVKKFITIITPNKYHGLGQSHFL